MDDDSNQMLTTVDNPWNPFVNYDEWYAFDNVQGYDTPGLLARIANVSLDLSDQDLNFEIQQAMQEIADLNVSGMHVLINRPTSTA